MARLPCTLGFHLTDRKSVLTRFCRGPPEYSHKIWCKSVENFVRPSRTHRYTDRIRLMKLCTVICSQNPRPASKIQLLDDGLDWHQRTLMSSSSKCALLLENRCSCTGICLIFCITMHKPLILYVYLCTCVSVCVHDGRPKFSTDLHQIL